MQVKREIRRRVYCWQPMLTEKLRSNAARVYTCATKLCGQLTNCVATCALHSVKCLALCLLLLFCCRFLRCYRRCGNCRWCCALPLCTLMWLQCSCMHATRCSCVCVCVCVCVDWQFKYTIYSACAPVCLTFSLSTICCLFIYCMFVALFAFSISPLAISSVGVDLLLGLCGEAQNAVASNAVC